MIAALFAFFVAVFCVFFVRRYPEYKRRKELLDAIPGPKSYPIVGNGLELTSPRKVYTKIQEWSKKYGPIYKIWIGPKVQYVVSDPDLIEFITTSNDLLTKADFYKFSKRWIGEGLITSDGDKWRNHRKAITPCFHFKILEQFIEVFDKNEKILIKKLEKEVGKSSFDIYPYITLYTLDVISETAMGVSINAQEKSESEYVKAVRKIIQIIVKRTFSGLLQFDFIYQFTSTYREEIECLKIIRGLTESVIKIRRDELLGNERDKMKNEKLHINIETHNGKSKDSKQDDHDIGIKKKKALLDMLLEATVDGKPFTDLEIREEVDTFMFTGYDTTASSISFVLYCLANHPDVQKKVVEELESIFLGDKDRCPTYAELQEMIYLDKVIKEAQRIYTISVLYGRSLPDDLQYGQYTFLKGASMFICGGGIHMDPKYYPEPEKFNPERFEGESQRHPFSFIPFSAGQRNCMGFKFAQLEMKAVVSKVLMNYELVPAVPKHELFLVNEGVLKSQNGVHVGLKRRVVRN